MTTAILIVVDVSIGFSAGLLTAFFLFRGYLNTDRGIHHLWHSVRDAHERLNKLEK